MKIRLVAAQKAVARHVLARLARFDCTGELRDTPIADVTLRHRADIPDPVLDEILAALLPLQPEIRLAAELDVDVELGLGVSAAGQLVRLAVDSEPLGVAIQEELEALGFDVYRVVEPVWEQKLRHGRVAPAVRQLVRSVVAAHGVSVDEEPDQDGGDALLLWVADPADADPQAARARVPIEIQADDARAAQALMERLLAAGFVGARAWLRQSPALERFEVEPGPLRKAPAACAALEEIVLAHLQEAGVDLRRHPLHRALGNSVSPPRITLPMAACATGSLRPSAGPWFERWQVRLRIDDLLLGVCLAEHLRLLGCRDVALNALPDQPSGCVIRWGAAAEHMQVERALRMAIDEVLPAPQPLTVTRRLGDQPRIEIDLPVRASDDTRARRFAAAVAELRLIVNVDDASRRGALAESLGQLGFGSFSVHSICVAERPHIWASEVPDVVAARVAGIVHATTGVECPLEWGVGEEGTIEVFVPTQAPATPVRTLPAPRPLLEAGDTWLRIADIQLPRRAAAALETEALDRAMVEALVHLAGCVSQNIPCLFLGATSADRRWLVRHAASLLGCHVAVLDLRAGALPVPRAAAAPYTWLLLDEVHDAPSEIRHELARLLDAPPKGTFLCGAGALAYAGEDRERWLGDHVLRAPEPAELYELMQAHVYGAPISMALRGSEYRQDVAARPVLAGLASRLNGARMIAALARLGARIGVDRGRLLGWLTGFATLAPEQAWGAVLQDAAPEEHAAVQAAAGEVDIRLA